MAGFLSRPSWNDPAPAPAPAAPRVTTLPVPAPELVLAAANLAPLTTHAAPMESIANLYGNDGAEVTGGAPLLVAADGPGGLVSFDSFDDTGSPAVQAPLAPASDLAATAKAASWVTLAVLGLAFVVLSAIFGKES